MSGTKDYTDDNAESDFAAGFTAPVIKEPAVVKDEDAAKGEGDPAEGDDTDTNPDNGTAPPEGDDNAGDKGGEGDSPAEELVTVTKAQLERLLASADKIDGVDQQISKLFGTTGDLRQLVKTIQESTPKGVKLEIPADAFKEMEEEYPEIAAHMRASLEKALAGSKGTGEGDAEKDTSGDGAKPEAIKRLVEESVTTRELEILEEEHPDWRTVVGAVSDGKFDPNHPFRKWLAAQPQRYQERINSTKSPLVVSKAIDRYRAFEATQKKAPTPPNKKALARKDRFEEALTPRGDGSPPPPRKTADDEFDEGFRTG